MSGFTKKQPVNNFHFYFHLFLLLKYSFMKQLLFRTMLSSLVLLTACLSAKSQIFSPVGSVPPELGKEPTTILIIETEREAVNKAFDDVFSKNYKGSFEITGDGYATKKYSDTKKYRYVFQTIVTFVEARGFGDSRQPATYEYSYRILDRVTNKMYGDEWSTDAWKNYLKKYVKKLEDMRKSNAGE